MRVCPLSKGKCSQTENISHATYDMTDQGQASNLRMRKIRMTEEMEHLVNNRLYRT